MRAGDLKMTHAKKIIPVFILSLSVLIVNAQLNPKKYKADNWLNSKNEYEGRWRYGAGIQTGINTGVHVEIFKLSDICNHTRSITKKLSVDVLYSKEAIMFSHKMEEKNPTLTKGGNRYGLDLKAHAAFFYLGAGIEGGTREIDNVQGKYTDVVGRVGLEGKITAFRYKRNNLIHTGWFIEGKYNRCLKNDFNYFLPSFGLKINLIT